LSSGGANHRGSNLRACVQADCPTGWEKKLQEAKKGDST